MSTLHHLELAVIDVTDRISRELQFSSDAKKQVRDAFTILHDALENVEKVVCHAMEERMRALSAAIGTGQPSPETVDHLPEPPKPAKRQRSETEANVDA